MNIFMPPAVPSIIIGGRVFTDLTNLIMLIASGTGAATNNSTFRLFAGAAGYPVTTAKTLKIGAIRHHVNTADTNGVIYLGYADADIGNCVNTAFTNPNYLNGTMVGTSAGLPANTVGSFEYSVNWSIPAGKYLARSATGATQGMTILYGYEV